MNLKAADYSKNIRNASKPKDKPNNYNIGINKTKSSAPSVMPNSAKPKENFVKKQTTESINKFPEERLRELKLNNTYMFKSEENKICTTEKKLFNTKNGSMNNINNTSKNPTKLHQINYYQYQPNTIESIIQIQRWFRYLVQVRYPLFLEKK